MVMKVTMYAKSGCPFCQEAERLLRSRGATDLTVLPVDSDPAQREAMVARSNRTSTPQIFIGNAHVGGYDDLRALDAAGRLQGLLEGGPIA